MSAQIAGKAIEVTGQAFQGAKPGFVGEVRRDAAQRR